MIKSPLNYTGGKYKLLSQIIPLFPSNIHTFVDLFCGGCNVGINVKSKNIIFNDKNLILINLYNVLKMHDNLYSFKKIDKIIKKYNLSDTEKNGYEFYKCNSSSGLGKYNINHYNKLRSDFNKRTRKDENYYYMFYVLIIYSFNNQIRFNSKGEFNLPVGKRDFNKSMKNKLDKFINNIKYGNYEFISKDFKNVMNLNLKNSDFVYCDPPYLITCATYNESNGWNESNEKALLKTLDELNKKGIKFALSNVITSKGKTNTILLDWINKNNYTIYHLNSDYSNSNYHTKDKITKPDEVLITNYKKE